MNTDKIVVICPACLSKTRIPLVAKKIKFTCPVCKSVHFALNGEVIAEEKKGNEDIESEEERKGVGEQWNADETMESDTKAEEESAQVDEKERISATNGGDQASSATFAWKEEIKNQPGKRILYWKIACFLLAAGVAIFGFLYFSSLSERSKKDAVTQEFIKDLNREFNEGETNQEDFERIKSLMTPDTRKFFEIFVESQLLYKDSTSLNMLKEFVNTLQPLDIRENRQFMYKNATGDTVYFTAEYVPDGSTYLLHIDIRDFLK